MDIRLASPLIHTANPRIELYRLGETTAAEWFGSYIDAAWGIANRLGDLGLGTGDILPFRVRIVVPEDLKSAEEDRANRSEFIKRLDRIGIDYSVFFAEGKGNPGEPRVQASSEKLPEEPPREELAHEDPLQKLLDDYQAQYDRIEADSERQLQGIESQFRKGEIGRKQYNSQRAETLTDEVEKGMKLREELFRRLRGRNR